MSRFTRIAAVQVDPALREAVLAAYGDYAVAVAKDPGVLAWEIGPDVDDENLLRIVASFPDSEAHARHMQSEATVAVMAVLQPAIVGAPSFVQLNSHHVA